MTPPTQTHSTPQGPSVAQSAISSAAATAAVAADLSKIETIWEAWRNNCAEDDNRKANDTTIGAEDYQRAALILEKAARGPQALGSQHALLQGLQQMYDRTVPCMFSFGHFLTCFVTETKETYGEVPAARAADYLLHLLKRCHGHYQPSYLLEDVIWQHYNPSANKPRQHAITEQTAKELKIKANGTLYFTPGLPKLRWILPGRVQTEYVWWVGCWSPYFPDKPIHWQNFVTNRPYYYKVNDGTHRYAFDILGPQQEKLTTIVQDASNSKEMILHGTATGVGIKIGNYFIPSAQKLYTLQAVEPKT